MDSDPEIIPKPELHGIEYSIQILSLPSKSNTIPDVQAIHNFLDEFLPPHLGFQVTKVSP